MFKTEFREQVTQYVLDQADADQRIVAAAIIGSLAAGEGDRWSDIDLTFGVRDGVSILEVLQQWAVDLKHQFDAVHLFDVQADGTHYRVFLLPGCLQLDLSFSPASAFGAAGPRFKLLFGKAVTRPLPRPPLARDLFGYAVHHALRARICIARGRNWQAEYWISAARDYALGLACLKRGLTASYARGLDDLPATVHQKFAGGLVASLERDELMRALSCTIDGLLQQAEEVRQLANKVEPLLRELSAEWDGEPA